MNLIENKRPTTQSSRVNKTLQSTIITIHDSGGNHSNTVGFMYNECIEIIITMQKVEIPVAIEQNSQSPLCIHATIERFFKHSILNLLAEPEYIIPFHDNFVSAFC